LLTINCKNFGRQIPAVTTRFLFFSTSNPPLKNKRAQTGRSIWGADSSSIHVSSSKTAKIKPIEKIEYPQTYS